MVAQYRNITILRQFTDGTGQQPERNVNAARNGAKLHFPAFSYIQHGDVTELNPFRQIIHRQFKVSDRTHRRPQSLKPNQKAKAGVGSIPGSRAAEASNRVRVEMVPPIF